MSPSPIPTMTDLKAAARAGDAQAIAQLMNASFQPKGISVKVAKSGGVLKVLMESASLPDRKLAGAVRKGLDGIKPAGVEKVFLKAQSSGGEDSWTEQWALCEPQPMAETNAADSQPKAASEVNNEPQSGSGCGKIFIWGLIAILAILAGRGFLVYNGTWYRIQERFAGATEEQTAEQAPALDPFAEGVKYATNASTLAQTAESQDEWQRTSNLWNAAIEQMKAVQADSQNSEIAQQKVAEYEKNQQYAADRVASLEAQQQQLQQNETAAQQNSFEAALDELRRGLQILDPEQSVIVGVSPGLVEGEAKITIANSWFYEPKEVRLQFAQNLWDAWVVAYNPENADQARIRLVDVNGNKLGGSRSIGGSVIYVED